jgi:hypothetical protein
VERFNQRVTGKTILAHGAVHDLPSFVVAWQRRWCECWHKSSPIPTSTAERLTVRAPRLVYSSFTCQSPFLSVTTVTRLVSHLILWHTGPAFESPADKLWLSIWAKRRECDQAYRVAYPITAYSPASLIESRQFGAIGHAGDLKIAPREWSIRYFCTTVQAGLAAKM